MILPHPATQSTGRRVRPHLHVEIIPGIIAFTDPMMVQNNVVFLQGKHTQ